MMMISLDRLVVDLNLEQAKLNTTSSKLQLKEYPRFHKEDLENLEDQGAKDMEETTS